MRVNMITILDDTPKEKLVSKPAPKPKREVIKTIEEPPMINISSMVDQPHSISIPTVGTIFADTSRDTVSGIVTKTEDNLPEVYSNIPYKESYTETNNILKNAIMQIDIVTNEIKEDIYNIRSSKTAKNKYNNLSLMHGAFGGLIGNKIAAARELNNSIKHAHDLEFKRSKEFRIDNEVDDNKAILDTYNAFVNMPVSSTPVNGYSTPLGPNTADLTLISSNMMATAVGANPDITYQHYLDNLTPTQAMMMHEDNPDIKQVVVYNQDTFDKSFEMMNMRTGEILHGLPKRNSAMYMQDTTIDLERKIARNVNLDETYDIVIVGKGDMASY